MFWVHVGTRERFEEGFRTIADVVKLPGRNEQQADILRLVPTWLSNERNGKWVMILDNADDHGVFYNASPNTSTSDRLGLARYLPQSRNGSIIITTRDRDLAFRLTGNHRNMISVGPMTEKDALMLMERRLGSLSDVNVAVDIVRSLDHIPLAISQAAAYIQARAPRISLTKYLANLQDSERKRARLLRHDAGDLRRDGCASNSILTTWEISFNSIRSQRPSAAHLLSLRSFFYRQDIPAWVLKSSKQISANVHDDTASEWDSGDDDPTDSESDSSDADPADSESDSIDDEAVDIFEDDVAMLMGYHLISANEEGDEFEMHGLVQLSTRRWLEACGQHETFKCQYIKLMAASFRKADYSTACRGFSAHAEVAIEYRPIEYVPQLKRASLLWYGGCFAYSQHRYDVAERMLRISKETFEMLLGRDRSATLICTGVYASILEEQGRLEEFEKLLIQVIKRSKEKLGSDHVDTLNRIANLSSIYAKLSRWEEAEQLAVQVMETMKSKLGPEHPKTLASMPVLAVIWGVTGRFTDALMLMRSCAMARQRVLGPKHLDTLDVMSIVEDWSK